MLYVLPNGPGLVCSGWAWPPLLTYNMEVIMEKMPKYLKQQLFCLVLIMLLSILIVIFPSCATLTNLIGQPQLKTYTFTYNAQEYSAILPKEVPELPELAKQKLVCYDWTGPLCVNHVRYIENQIYPVVSFWFTANLGVVAIVYHADVAGRLEHIPYIYLKGVPVKVTPEEINELLEKWSKYPKK